MDTYLPADFHALHDSAAEDWRDVSSTHEPGPDACRSTTAAADRSGCADPSWRVF